VEHRGLPPQGLLLEQFIARHRAGPLGQRVQPVC
jgi:hypothetical protein